MPPLDADGLENFRLERLLPQLAVGVDVQGGGVGGGSLTHLDTGRLRDKARAPRRVRCGRPRPPRPESSPPSLACAGA